MGEHNRPELSFKIRLLCLFSGGLLVAAAVLEFIYRSPMGFFGTRATGRLLILGLLLMVTPIWSFFRKKKAGTRN
jgi:hypothetical protein